MGEIKSLQSCVSASLPLKRLKKGEYPSCDNEFSRLVIRRLDTTAVPDFDLVYFLLSCFCMPSLNVAVSDSGFDSYRNTGLLEMIVGVLTTCPTQYT
jgi:hypothetical protein